jgi:hypothetical protein
LSGSTDFQISLPGIINRVSEMELVHIEIPTYGYYMFSSERENNIFWMQVTSPPPKNEFYTPEELLYFVGTRTAIVIPDGNYTPQQLTTYLNTTYFYQNTATGNPFKNIQFVFNPTNFVCSFAIVDTTVSTYLILTFYDLMMKTDITNTFGWLIGFMSPIYQGETTLEAENAINLLINRSLYLSVNDYQYNNNNNNLVLLANGNCLDDFVLSKIVVPGISYQNAYNAYAVTELVSFPRKYNGPVDLKKFSVALYDDAGNKVTLSGLDFSFTLKLTIVYETL